MDANQSYTMQNDQEYLPILSVVRPWMQETRRARDNTETSSLLEQAGLAGVTRHRREPRRPMEIQRLNDVRLHLGLPQYQLNQTTSHRDGQQGKAMRTRPDQLQPTVKGPLLSGPEPGQSGQPWSPVGVRKKSPKRRLPTGLSGTHLCDMRAHVLCHSPRTHRDVVKQRLEAMAAVRQMAGSLDTEPSPIPHIMPRLAGEERVLPCRTVSSMLEASFDSEELYLSFSDESVRTNSPETGTFSLLLPDNSAREAEAARGQIFSSRNVRIIPPENSNSSMLLSTDSVNENEAPVEQIFSSQTVRTSGLENRSASLLLPVNSVNESGAPVEQVFSFQSVRTNVPETRNSLLLHANNSTMETDAPEEQANELVLSNEKLEEQVVKPTTAEQENQSEEQTDVEQRELHKSSSDMSSVSKVLETELECVICNELFVRATSLNCSHTFCAVCISRWMLGETQCPICRAPIVYFVRPIVLDSFIDKITKTLSPEMAKYRHDLVNERREELRRILENDNPFLRDWFADNRSWNRGPLFQSSSVLVSSIPSTTMADSRDFSHSEDVSSVDMSPFEEWTQLCDSVVVSEDQEEGGEDSGLYSDVIWRGDPPPELFESYLHELRMRMHRWSQLSREVHEMMSSTSLERPASPSFDPC